jgi:hypothetical protein
LRLDGIGRPENDDRICGLQSLLDDIGISAMRGKLIISPHLVAL